jgi:hypothetical protein
MDAAPLTFLSEEDNRLWRQKRGWLLSSAAELLYRYAFEADPRGEVVEIGSFAGKSTICIARGVRDSSRTVKRVTAIDIQFQADLVSNLASLGADTLVERIERPSLSAAERWTRPISFIYIDGHHGKAHAYADLVVWDTLILPGSVVALDDTIGFMIGPNLQMQAALMSGAYVLLAEAGGVSFLRKVRNLSADIGDHPLTAGSRLAYLHYVSAWLGAADPAFRLPQYPSAQPAAAATAAKPTSAPRGLRAMARRVWNTSPREAVELLMRQAGPATGVPQRAASARARSGDDRATATKLAEAERLLELVEAYGSHDARETATLAYLRGCLLLRKDRVADAIEMLRPLTLRDATLELEHYRIPVRDLARLRLAQALDLSAQRPLADAQYRSLASESLIPELVRAAEEGMREPFTPPASDPAMLLREYNLELLRFRRFDATDPV